MGLVACTNGHCRSVPPTAVTYGLEAIPLTASPNGSLYGGVNPFCGVQAADPESPAATKTLMPAVAACWNVWLYSVFPAVPSFNSHSP